MKIAEQIAALEKSVKEAQAKQTALVTKSGAEARSFNDEERQQFDAITAEVKTLQGDIERLKGMQEADAKTAKPLAIPAQPKGVEVKEKGIAFAQYVRTLAQADGNKYIAAQIAEKQAKEGRIDSRVPMFAKAAVSGATTDNGSWAGNLVHDPGVIVQDFVSYLRDRTIIGQFGQGGIPALRPGVEDVPIDVQSGKATAGWVGEGQAKPVTSWSYDTRKLAAYKLAAIAVASEELLRKATTAADVMLRDELAAAVGEAEDSTFISTASGSTTKPAGILKGAAKQASSAAAGASQEEKFEADFAYMVQTMISAKMPFTGMTIIMSASNAFALSRIRDAMGNAVYPQITMTGGNVSGVPVLVSDYVGDTVVMMNAGEIYLVAGGGVDVRMSNEASLEMDSAPTGSSKTPTGASLVSMFQTNSTAFLVEERIGWERRRDAAVVYVTGANYAVANA